MKAKKKVLTFFVVLALYLILNSITTTVVAEKSSLTVINKTGHFLHVFIDGEIYPYVNPYYSLTHVTSARELVHTRVFYSPGQGKTSRVIDSTFTLPYTPPQQYTTNDGYDCSCSDPNYSHSCSSPTETVDVPAQGGNVIWEVTEDDFEN